MRLYLRCPCGTSVPCRRPSTQSDERVCYEGLCVCTCGAHVEPQYRAVGPAHSQTAHAAPLVEGREVPGRHKTDTRHKTGKKDTLMKVVRFDRSTSVILSERVRLMVCFVSNSVHGRVDEWLIGWVVG